MEEIEANTLREILEKNGFDNEKFFFYGEEIAKIKDYEEKGNRGKLILVTSTSPTKFGEGKTTLAISLSDALNQLHFKSAVVLREPSLGPVFGTKGGATGGGCASVLPEMDINLHFTGDIHAVTTANNLLAAIIDNHIFQGNALNIDPDKVMHERCIDLNDRSLRTVEMNGHVTHFNISTASEFMAILCLAKNEADLKEHLENILVGYTFDDQEVFVKDLQCVNALLLLLKDALKPNVVKTKEDNIALIHGGPFANIAHGTNSVISTLYALHHFDYTVVEAGFGSDMGGVKYFDLLTRMDGNFIPDVVVLNTTIRSLKHNGNGSLEEGIANLEYHINNMLHYTNNFIVVLNRHESDLEQEIGFIKKYVEDREIDFAVSNGYLEGSNGSLASARKIVALAAKETTPVSYSYDLEDDLKSKIEKFCQKNYGAKEIHFSEEAMKKLNLIQNSKFKNLPICIAKTQYSITDDAKVLGYPKDFVMSVTNIKLFSGAGFITVYFGNILTMPGLGKDANYMHM